MAPSVDYLVCSVTAEVDQLGASAKVPNVNAAQGSDMHERIGQIVVRDVTETRLRMALPDCEIVAVGTDVLIAVQHGILRMCIWF